MTLGKKIEISRREKGLSQNDLEKMTGIRAGLLSLYENDKINKIGLQNITRIARALDKPISYFVDSNVDESKELLPIFNNYQRLLTLISKLNNRKVEALIELLE